MKEITSEFFAWRKKTTDVTDMEIAEAFGHSNPRTFLNWQKVGIPKGKEGTAIALMDSTKLREDSTYLIRVPFTDGQLKATSRAANIVGSELQEYCQRAIAAEVERFLSEKTIPFAAEEPKEYRTFEIPFYGSAAAGSQVVSQLEGETIRVSKKYPAGHFAIEVNGASMEPTLPDGCRIICEPKEHTAKHGKICIISDGHGSSVKRYDGKRKAFISDNPAFPDFTPADEVKLQGYYVETL